MALIWLCPNLVVQSILAIFSLILPFFYPHNLERTRFLCFLFYSRPKSRNIEDKDGEHNFSLMCLEKSRI